MVKVHPQALVESDKIGDGTNVWAFAHVMKDAVIGSCCNIGDHAFIESGAQIGNNVTIKNQVLIWEGVTIQDDVFIGPRVTFTNDRFPRSPRMPEASDRYKSRESWLAATLVRKGCSIGAGAIICPGLELGEYCVIGAGAVVTRNVAPFSLVVGSPARHLRFVCTCGLPLTGKWDSADCAGCGESGCRRLERLKKLNPSTIEIENSVCSNEHKK